MHLGRQAFVRNYCSITGARQDSFHMITRIFEQRAASAAQRAEKRGLRRKPLVKPGAAAGGHFGTGDSSRVAREKDSNHSKHASDMREAAHARAALSKALLDETQVSLRITHCCNSKNAADQ